MQQSFQFLMLQSREVALDLGIVSMFVRFHGFLYTPPVQAQERAATRSVDGKEPPDDGQALVWPFDHFGSQVIFRSVYLALPDNCRCGLGAIWILGVHFLANLALSAKQALWGAATPNQGSCPAEFNRALIFRGRFPQAKYRRYTSR